MSPPLAGACGGQQSRVRAEFGSSERLMDSGSGAESNARSLALVGVSAGVQDIKGVHVLLGRTVKGVCLWFARFVEPTPGPRGNSIGGLALFEARAEDIAALADMIDELDSSYMLIVHDQHAFGTSKVTDYTTRKIYEAKSAAHWNTSDSAEGDSVQQLLRLLGQRQTTRVPQLQEAVNNEHTAAIPDMSTPVSGTLTAFNECLAQARKRGATRLGFMLSVRSASSPQDIEAYMQDEVYPWHRELFANSQLDIKGVYRLETKPGTTTFLSVVDGSVAVWERVMADSTNVERLKRLEQRAADVCLTPIAHYEEPDTELSVKAGRFVDRIKDHLSSHAK
ncbi:hypothetical protein FVE85_4319 [Porphyridium purpureum]|uniref:Uncharacterized protein n=1 Tax=Porphyridium purpureum TaxID=35688 RepID=A0A5J4YUG5_PORPP|nr:hypothetical protein FVE85_4319 [Porphyridium purpureum]|eukprot:POR3233..scf229_5